MDEHEPWSCTVVRAYGLHLMRPEKSWRPIVTVELDKTQQHETVLGSDGQNINLKDAFYLRDVSLTSQVDVKVFHRSQSKKKGKKRSLVGSASCSLGEMLKRHGKEPSELRPARDANLEANPGRLTRELELRLQCQNSTNRSIASRGRPQNGAVVHLKLRPPAWVDSYLNPIPAEDVTGIALRLRVHVRFFSAQHRSGDDLLLPANDSTTLPPSSTEADVEPNPPPETTMRRRRRVRSYCVNSDDEALSYSEDDTDDERKPLLFDDGQDECPPSPIKIAFTPLNWIAASLLPQYTERIPVPPEALSLPERLISSFTVYREMKHALCDADFEKVFTRLQMEWTYTSGLLVALAAVDTAVFSISPGSIFAINPLARSAVAASSIASGLGIACAAWFLVRYAWVDLETFIDRAADILSTETEKSYFFFCLSSRIPSILMLVSAIALMLFLAFVAFAAWPMAVVVGCFIVGLLMGLQFLVFTVLWVVRGVRRGYRGLARLVFRDFDRRTVEEGASLSLRSPMSVVCLDMSAKPSFFHIQNDGRPYVWGLTALRIFVIIVRIAAHGRVTALLHGVVL
ncbi:hypothetical protein B0H10DRAFT_2430240 [Mycena sp. CBHHK59/15]|nr:hypothetical protein B0H10DRAFT_2430240 [Mycena sp. CBHHK59/15]